MFDGHTADPLTVPTPVEQLRTCFGLTEVVCVRARGLVKSTGKTVRATAGYQAITALTTTQGRTRLREGVLRPERLTPHVYAVPRGPVRLVRRQADVAGRRGKSPGTGSGWCSIGFKAGYDMEGI